MYDGLYVSQVALSIHPLAPSHHGASAQHCLGVSALWHGSAGVAIAMGGSCSCSSQWGNFAEWEELKNHRGLCFYFLGNYSKGR